MKTQILTRFDRTVEEEILAAPDSFSCVDSRMKVSPDSLVIGRYSVLPYYQELENDLATIGSRLVNSYSEHRFIANIEQWYPVVEQWTPKTWFGRWDLLDPNGSYVVKGKTNSQKWKWDTHMFAEGKEALMRVLGRLRDDSFIYDQGLVVREYVPLKTFEVGLNGLPFTNEWRFFFLGENEVDHGFYWSTMEDVPSEIAPEAIEFARNIAREVSKHTNFFVLDIAEKAEGGWILIEINDGQMSGLSEIPASRFYQNLAVAISPWEEFPLDLG